VSGESVGARPWPNEWPTPEPMDPWARPPSPLETLPGVPFLHKAAGALLAGPTGGGRSAVVQACAYDAALAGLHVLYLGHEVTKEEFDTARWAGVGWGALATEEALPCSHGSVAT
jgi:hypothetical protein